MRAVSWNIERGYKVDKVANQLKSLDADIIMLYELDNMVGRTQDKNVFEIIKESLGYYGKSSIEFTGLESSDGTKSGVMGNAVFSRYPVENYVEIRLPIERPSAMHLPSLVNYYTLAKRKGSRMAQYIEVISDGQKVSALSMHLDLIVGGWDIHKYQLQTALDGCTSKPDIIAGDFNNVQGATLSALRGKKNINPEVGKVRQWLLDEGYADPYLDTDATTGKYGITGKIDWLAFRNGLEVKSHEFKQTKYSDHAYLVVDI